MLENNSQSATFFCMSWMAEKYPDVIKSIINNGYEIGTHSARHQLVYEQTPFEFKEDLKRSIQTLEDISGNKVKYYRAPGFSITEKEKWAFEILIEQGIEIDSSVFPALRAHGGFPSYGKATPSIIRYNGLEIKELPINTYSLLGKNLIFSGGGYFRILPYQMIQKMTKSTDYIMTYFHPRDFDYKQPMIKELPLSRKFKSYYGLKGTQSKFELWINEFNFVNINTANKMINWGEVPIISLQAK
jgi:polysaccharide deacetylase family protein (PEP-CTERM system associated)